MYEQSQQITAYRLVSKHLLLTYYYQVVRYHHTILFQSVAKAEMVAT